MSKSRSLTLVLLVALAFGLLGGCGGDTRRGEEGGRTAAQGSSTEASTTANPAAPPVIAKVKDPARRAYIARVDGVCSRLDPERKSAEERVGNSRDAQEAARSYEDSIAAGEAELRRIEAIPVPPGERQLVRTNVFDVIRRQLAVRRQIGAALAAVDVARLRTLRVELDDLTRSLTGFARGYGFRVCGEE
jgi:hypothetical protein